MTTLHVTNGDSAAATLRTTRLGGDVGGAHLRLGCLRRWDRAADRVVA